MWAHIPKGFCPSAPEPANSIEASEWRSRILASSVSLNEKQPQSSYWLRAWKKGTWTTRLFGRIYEPSTAQRGVAAYMASLPEFPASRIRSPGSGSEQTTPETSGHLQPSLFELSAPSGSSSKTSRAYSSTTTFASARSYALWVSALRRASSRRRRLARHTSANGSSSWPTAQSRDYKGESGRSIKGEELDLPMAARNWPTPDTQNSRDGTPRAEAKGAHAVSLHHKVAQWPTPSANEDAAGTVDGKMQRMLTHAAKGFSLPAPETTQHGLPSSQGAPTSRRQWPTPSMAEANGSGGRASRTEGRQAMLHDEAKTFTGDTRKQLNPRFVEWLMGWEPGWTSLAPLDCGSRGTGSCRSRQHSHSKSCEDC